jgi:hypothetical protein
LPPFWAASAKEFSVSGAALSDKSAATCLNPVLCKSGHSRPFQKKSPGSRMQLKGRQKIACLCRFPTAFSAHEKCPQRADGPSFIYLLLGNQQNRQVHYL